MGLAMLALSGGTFGFSTVVASFAISEAPHLAFFDAFVLVLPLSMLITGVAWAAFAERMRSLTLWTIGILGAVVITYLAGRLGIDPATRDAMSAAIESVGSSPWVRPFGVLDAYLTYYTWVPFIGGIITGLATGWTCHRLTSPPPE